MVIHKSRALLDQAVRGIVLLFLAALPLVASSQDLDLVDVTLVDGTGAAPRPGVTVTVRGGRIAAIVERAPPIGRACAASISAAATCCPA